MIPKVEANFTTSLAAKLSSTATTLTLNRSTDDDGSTLNDTYLLTLSEGSSNEEHMLVDLSGASGTITTRGLSRVDAATNQSGNQFEHDRGASVKITNLALIRVVERLNGDEAFDSVDWTGVNSIDGFATPTSGETTKAANVAYVNAAAIAGAADAAENVKGIVEIATPAELAAGTATGSTGALLVPHAEDCGNTSSAKQMIPITDADGDIPVEFMELDAAWTYTSTLDVATATNWQLGGVAYTGTMATLNEADTFFGATDISGAEAETLTDGSDADSLHIHESAVRGWNFAAFLDTTFKAGDKSYPSGFSDDTTKVITVGSYRSGGGGGHFLAGAEIVTDYGVSVAVTQTYSQGIIAVGVGVVYIGTDTWDSYTTNGMAKNGAGVTFASGDEQGPLGHDPTNDYLLMLTSTTNIRRFTGIAGTTITQFDNITLDTAVTEVGFLYDDTNSRYVCVDISANIIRRFDSSGTTVDTASYTLLADNLIRGVCAIDSRVHLVCQTNGDSNNSSTPVLSGIAVNLIPTTMTL